MSLLVSVLARRVWIAVLVVGILPVATQAQSDRPSDSGQPPTQQSQPPNASDAKAPPAAPEGNAAPSGRMQISSPASSTPVDMLIGPGDEGDMTVYGVPELSTHFRVESSGDAYLPLIGKFHMAGLSANAAQAQINEKYESGGFLHNPHVNIYIKEYMTQGISVLGEVTRPRDLLGDKCAAPVRSFPDCRRAHGSCRQDRDHHPLPRAGQTGCGHPGKWPGRQPG